MAQVPVHVATELTAEQAKSQRIADNQTASIAEWDLELLPAELLELKELGLNLDLLGFDDDQLKRPATERDMQLNRRIEKLERAIGVTGECRDCDGRGQGRIAMAVNGADLVPLDPPGCPACGKGHVFRRVIVNGLDAERMRVLYFLGRCAAPAA